jgi:hypothetical protein
MKKRVYRLKPASLILLLLAGMCGYGVVSGQESSGNFSIHRLPTPAPVNSSLSRVVSDETGQVYLSWVSQQDDLAQLSFSKLLGNEWSSPVLISEGTDWFVNWADFPLLSVNGGNMVAHWLRMSASGTYDYDIEASFFDADENSWSEPRVIHTDGVSAEHGFVSMLPMSDKDSEDHEYKDSTLITWLDGRNTKVGDEYGEMTLRAGVFDAKGNALNEWELDARVCDCCQTSTAMTAKGPILVYRDRSENEIRDISVIRYSEGVWTKPVSVHNDNWQIAGCPVNGPSVSANEEQVAVAWFTAKDDIPKVQLALSEDSGDSFSDPVVVASPQTNGRVGTAILDSGGIVVSWLDTSETDAAIMLSHYSSKGVLLENIEVAKTSASRRSGFPVIESAGDTVYVSWTDISDTPQVSVARIELNLAARANNQ